MVKKVLRDVALWCWFYLAAKPYYMGVDVDGLACPLHHSTAYSRQKRGQCLLSGTALSRQVVVGGGATRREP
jgi:hypothetical protein